MNSPPDWVAYHKAAPIAWRHQRRGLARRSEKSHSHNLAGLSASSRPEIADKSEHNTPRPVATQAAHCEVFRVPYSVHFAEDVDAPADLRTKALEILVEISKTLESIPSSSVFWSAANSGLAELNLGGWQFEYRVHHRDRRIVVVGARQLSDHRAR